jgi:hypothetical protein
MSLPLEQVTDYDGKLDVDTVQRNFDAVSIAMPGLGGASVEVRFGVGTMTWPGGQSISTELTISHGLGRIPKVVVATMQTNGQGQVVAVHAGAYTSTTFKAQADWVQGFSPAAGTTMPVGWIAIG